MENLKYEVVNGLKDAYIKMFIVSCLKFITVSGIITMLLFKLLAKKQQSKFILWL